MTVLRPRLAPPIQSGDGFIAGFARRLNPGSVHLCEHYNSPRLRWRRDQRHRESEHQRGPLAGRQGRTGCGQSGLDGGGFDHIQHLAGSGRTGNFNIQPVTERIVARRRGSYSRNGAGPDAAPHKQTPHWPADGQFTGADGQRWRPGFNCRYARDALGPSGPNAAVHGDGVLQ